jgi:hypothetical protein
MKAVSILKIKTRTFRRLYNYATHSPNWDILQKLSKGEMVPRTHIAAAMDLLYEKNKGVPGKRDPIKNLKDKDEVLDWIKDVKERCLPGFSDANFSKLLSKAKVPKQGIPRDLRLFKKNHSAKSYALFRIRIDVPDETLLLEKIVVYEAWRKHKSIKKIVNEWIGKRGPEFQFREALKSKSLDTLAYHRAYYFTRSITRHYLEIMMWKSFGQRLFVLDQPEELFPETFAIFTRGKAHTKLIFPKLNNHLGYARLARRPTYNLE